MHLDLGPAFWALVALSLAAALAYGLIFLNQPRTLLRAAVKTAFMGALAGAFAAAGAPTILIAALACAALGDLFLAFDKTWTLGLGILSFLGMQLLYTLIFFGLWLFSGDNGPLWPRYVMMGLIIAVSAGFLLWIAPKLKWLALGVVPYSLAIVAMVCMAMWLPWAGWAAMLGALSFLVSDGVLSAELFKLPEDAPVRKITAPVVWWTYAAAQVLIVYGMMQAAAVMN
ncbi:MAG: lysoplasmalogenase [Hyphomonadaceae bacterium]|nr:lysoplasmalogenase [Hyphomonadaceae bacterium]